ncbi:formate transporter FocA [Gilliamella apis]|uniref:formate transporter FocA n=1 Tax=Gilliamella apis TaxID=1970738 RepID=UPI000A59E52D|nr:formate transporter FocA [Gilliamella apis]
MSNDKLVDSFSPAQMTQIAEELGNYKVNKHPSSTILSAILAGVFISIAFVFYITATTGTATVAFGLAKLVGGICFSLGLMLVVCCGTDLFTSTILTILPKMTHRISWVKMFRNWIFVYIGNFIGAILFVAIIWFSGQYMVANGLWGLNVLQTADHKLHHTFIEAVFLGLLANLMVCLAAWMSYAGRSLLDKMLIMVLPVAMFVASGFEHSIANMFMIPMGIVINNFASPEFWTAVGVAPDTFKALTVEHFIVNNLIPVTIGNILGGLLVAVPNWALHLRKPH